MTQRVDIILPTGEAATVPVEDLQRAIDAGAKVPAPAAEQGISAQEVLTGVPEGTGRPLHEQAALGLLARAAGAARTVSLGLSDRALVDGAYIVGGDKVRREMRDALKVAREEQQVNTLAGEGFGLLMPGPLGAVGGAVEGGVAARAGEGLLASAGAMAARGGAEGAMLGAGRVITEDALGDHPLTGETLFASMAKDALIGAGAGAVLGAGAYGASKAARSLFGRSPGRAADAVLDEVAGTPTAGKALREDAKAAEGLIADLENAGATSEQAAQMADDLNRLTRLKTTPEPSAGLRWQPHPNAKPHETTVTVEAAELDRLWQRDPAKGYYIGRGQEGIPGRRQRFAEFRRKNPSTPVQASRVSATDDGAVAFTDGRHRFAELRDAGVGRVAVTIPKEDLAKLPAALGARPLEAAGERSGGVLSDAIDSLAAEYASKKAGGNPQIREVLAKGYAERATRLAERGRMLDEQALKLKSVTDRVLAAERAMDEAQFLQRPDRMAKLIDTSLGKIQRDTAARMNQEVDNTLRLLESTATRGGSPVAVTKIRKQLADVAKLSITAARDEAGRIVQLPPKKLHELYMGLNRMKQTVGREAGFGIAPHLRTEAQREFGTLYETLRVALEDESVWGAEAGSNQRILNEVFSTDFKRSNDFLNRFTVGLDEARGVPLPEADAEKLKNALLRKLGSEADSQQAIKSTETWIDRNRKRIAALEEHGDLTPHQAKLLADGREALSEFERTFADARKEAEVLARLEEQQLQEQGQAMGGLVGLGVDLVTRPLTTMERLAGVRQATRRLEKAVERGFERLLKTKAPPIESATPRAKDEVAKEIGEVKELATNGVKLQERLASLVGDLGDFAPKVADEVKATATRAIIYLAQEAPQGSVPRSPVGFADRPRYSDQQIAEWESKRRAVLGAMDGTTAPEAIIEDMRRGKLNRDAIQALEFVSPRLFQRMREMAHEELVRMEQKGLLDAMPYQQKAAISTLLGVPADGTWTPDFIGMMQSLKAAPAPQKPSAPASFNPGVSKRAVKMNTDIYATDAQTIGGM